MKKFWFNLPLIIALFFIAAPAQSTEKVAIKLDEENPKVYRIGTASGFGTEVETFWMDAYFKPESERKFKEIIIENRHDVAVDMPFFVVTYKKDWRGKFETILRNKKIPAKGTYRVRLSTLFSPKVKVIGELRMEFKQRTPGASEEVVIYGIRK